MTFRLAHTSDLHIDEHSDFDETVEMLDWFVGDVRSRQPHVILIAGDTFPVNVRPSTPLERKTLRGLFLALAQTAPVVIISGNHDEAAHDIDIFHSPGERIHVFSQPGSVRIGDALVITLPWPSMAYLLGTAEQTGQSVAETCRDALKAILRSFAVLFAQHRGPKILVSHLNVLGVNFGGFVPLGQAVEVTAEDLLMTGADWIALGHIHKYNMVCGKHGGYSGSLRRIDFGEEGEDKGYVIADIEPGRTPVHQFIYSPIRKMETIAVDLSDPFSMEGKRFTHGSRGRLIITVDEEARAGVDLRAILTQLGAAERSDIKPSWNVKPKVRVRAPEMAKARTDAERVQTYLSTLEPQPDAEAKSRLLQLFGTLQAIEG